MLRKINASVDSKSARSRVVAVDIGRIGARKSVVWSQLEYSVT